MSTKVADRPVITDKVKDSHGGWTCGGSQVVLYNDDHNNYEYVVGCLVSVFGHSQSIAEKITREAHEKGRAIAEVEDAEKANEHARQLGSMGLKASVEGF